jgi:hypothetical protein
MATKGKEELMALVGICDGGNLRNFSSNGSSFLQIVYLIL